MNSYFRLVRKRERAEKFDPNPDFMAVENL